MKILIKDGIIVTMNAKRQIIQGDILIEDDQISQLGDVEFQQVDKTIDARGKLVIPGLIQSHVHLCQTLFRGMADDLQLLDWLNLRIWPLEAAHDEDSLYYSALLGCGELLRGGTTSVIDMGTVRHTSAIFEAVSRAGIRYLGGKCMMDHGNGNAALLTEDTTTSLQESVDLLERWHGRENGRLNYAFCPRFVPSCSEEMLLQVKQLADEYQVPVHTHASENKDEIELVIRERGRRNIVYLNDLGLLNERLILAHCIQVDKAEQNLLTTAKVNVAHCPSCNLKLASGIAPVPEYLKRGVNVSLGADGAPANNNLSMFIEMRMSALIQKPIWGPTVMPAEEVFEMATLGGARAMGLQGQIGSLEEGKKADIVVVDINKWHTCPVSAAGVYAQLVYQVQTQDVCCTIIDGKIIMEKGEFLTLDQADILQGAESSLQRVRQRAGLV
ncbi:MAG: N-ethylammeline chlorohydrolase [Firmicutes bacterium HGW-Firmicutes-15]|nr:MAG: N-ethylammeline chlorohydrolase [Firmicutes bacterium HGW-Firmicutes-15]